MSSRGTYTITRHKHGPGETVATADSFDEALTALTLAYYDESGAIPQTPERYVVVLVTDDGERTVFDSETASEDNAGILGITVALCATASGSDGTGGAAFAWNTDRETVRDTYDRERQALLDGSCGPERCSCYFIPNVYMDLYRGASVTAILDAELWHTLIPDAHDEPRAYGAEWLSIAQENEDTGERDVSASNTRERETSPDE